MGIWKIVSSGVWPSITGGWYYDPYLSRFSNALHLYIWLFYLLVPLVFYVALPLNFAFGTLYVVLIGLSLGGIKLTNLRLHSMLDGGVDEQQQQQQQQDGQAAQPSDSDTQPAGETNVETTAAAAAADGSGRGDEASGQANSESSSSSGAAPLADAIVAAANEAIANASIVNSRGGGAGAGGDGAGVFDSPGGPDSCESGDRAHANSVDPVTERLPAAPRYSTDTQDTLMLEPGMVDSVNRHPNDLSLDACTEQEESGGGGGSSAAHADSINSRRAHRRRSVDADSTSRSVLARSSNARSRRNSGVPATGSLVLTGRHTDHSRSDEHVAVDDGGHAVACSSSVPALSDDASSTAGYLDLPLEPLQRNSGAASGESDRAAATAPDDEGAAQAAGANDDMARHLARSHNDTTDGAIHCYTDEDGLLHMYSFGVDGATDIIVEPSIQHLFQESGFGTAAESGGESHRNPPPPVPPRVQNPVPIRNRPSAGTESNIAILEARYRTPAAVKISDPGMRFCPIPGLRFSIPVKIDRLKLTSLLDRDRIVPDILIALILAMLSAGLGYALLACNFYEDFSVFAMCFVLAAAHYSLVKSVQPDPASSTQDDNRWTALSRPIYLIVVASVVLILDAAAQSTQSVLVLYGIDFHSQSVLYLASRCLQIFVLCFPAVFTLGLLPQFNIFVLYCLEQIDLHVFGGNGTSGLAAAIFSNFRTAVVFAICYGFVYAAGTASNQQTTPWLSVAVCLLTSLSYHLSRVTSNPAIIWLLAKNCFKSVPDEPSDKLNPYPQQLQDTVLARYGSDFIACVVLAVVTFAIHATTLFQYKTVLWVLCGVAAFVGFFVHYLTPQLRKHQPWLCAEDPVLRAHEYNAFEVTSAAKVTWFERFVLCAHVLERLVLYPIIFASAVTVSAPGLFDKFGIGGGAAVLVVTGIRMIRGSFTDISFHYVFLSFAALFFQFDFKGSSETFLVDFFLSALIIRKSREFFQKMYFVLTYIAPWQQIWGSSVHVAAQPLSVPHSGMLLLQSIISSIFSTPLTPFVGSAIFLNSYVRPIKFWERDYSTRRVDNSNTRLSSQIDENPGNDDNNLNSIFYEHLTRSLRQTLCGDVSLGRWGQTYAGDFFLLASDSLNALVHVVEVGNGHVTFQLRGLEFKGTYCQQREVEAINEDLTNDNCCCCHPGHPPGMLSVNLMFQQRWLAWEVKARRFVLEGYSITANGAAAMLNAYDMRKILLAYYVKAIIFYTIRSEKIFEWLEDETLDSNLFGPHLNANAEFVDLDLSFSARIDSDYDVLVGGLTQHRFYLRYGDFLTHCAQQRSATLDSREKSKLVILCFALSLLGRRVLNTAANNDCLSVSSFLYGLHAVFKGDVRIVSYKDEWVFSNMDMLLQIIKPSIRMSLKLHQDHFLSTDEYDDPETLRMAIEDYHTNMVIAHESDPAWRNAVLDNVPSLLALRHVTDDAPMNGYKIVMLNKRFLSFRVIKVNEECVRGLWAGQQYELIFLRNSNAERGSIQNARQALRNIINSSCDIGYPIYVSPLTTSYVESNPQVAEVLGPSLSFTYVVSKLRQCFRFAWCRLTGSQNEENGGCIDTIDRLPTRRVVFGTTPANSAAAASTGGPSARSPLMPSVSSQHSATGLAGGGAAATPAPATAVTTAAVASGGGDDVASPASSPQRAHPRASVSVSGGNPEPSQTGSSIGAPWTSSIGGGEEGSTASVGFRLAHGSMDSLRALSSVMTDRESHTSAFPDATKSSASGQESGVHQVHVASVDEMASIEGMSICGSSVAGMSTVSQVANAGSLAYSAQGTTASAGDSSSHIDSISRADISSRADTHSRLDSQSVAETTSRSEVFRRHADSCTGSIHSTGLSVAASSDMAAAGSMANMDNTHGGGGTDGTDGVSLSNGSHLDNSSRGDMLESTSSRAHGSLAGSGSLRSDRWSSAVSDLVMAGSIAGGYSGAGDSLVGAAGSIAISDGASTRAAALSMTGGGSMGGGSNASLEPSRASLTAPVQLPLAEVEVDFPHLHSDVSVSRILDSKSQHQFRILRVELIFKHISDNEPMGLDIRWPDEDMRLHCSPSYWQSKGWWPAKGVIGRLVHVWLPTKQSDASPERYHKLPGFGAILVLQCEGQSCCVAIDQTAVADLGALC